VPALWAGWHADDVHVMAGDDACLLKVPHLCLLTAPVMLLQHPGQQGALQGRGLAQDALHPTVRLVGAA
jgi:hypothetical protein